MEADGEIMQPAELQDLNVRLKILAYHHEKEPGNPKQKHQSPQCPIREGVYKA